MKTGQEDYDGCSSHLPVVEEIAQESVDGLFEVEIAVDVKVPHLLRHLDIQVEHAGGRPEHHLAAK